MKRIIMFVLLFAALKVAGQTTGYLRFDTVKIMKQGGSCELYIINKTKDSLGLLTNIGGGLTAFKKPKVLNDSTIVIGNDTLVIPGATGGSSTLANVGTGYRLATTPNGSIKTLSPGYGVLLDSTTTANTITASIDTSSTNHVVTKSDLNDAIAGAGGSLQETMDIGNVTDRTYVYDSTATAVDGSATGGYIMRIEPLDKTDDPPPFLMSMGATKFPGVTTRDNVFHFGINLNSGGGQYIGGKSGIGESWEGMYIPSVGDTIDKEKHEFYITRSGQQIRLSSYTIRDPYGIDYYNTVSRHYYKVPSTGRVHYTLQPSTEGSQSIWAWSDTKNFTIAYDTINGVLFNLAGTVSAGTRAGIFTGFDALNMPGFTMGPTEHVIGDGMTFRSTTNNSTNLGDASRRWATVWGVDGNYSGTLRGLTKVIAGPSTAEFGAAHLNVSNNANAGSIASIENVNSGNAAYEQLLFLEDLGGNKYAEFARFNTNASGNIPGTSIPYAESFTINNYSGTVTPSKPIGFTGNFLFFGSGSTSTNFGWRSDATGFSIKPMSALHNSNTYSFAISATDAMLLPVGTTAQRPTATAGLFRYNSDSTKIEWYNGSAWVQPGTGGADGNGIYSGSGSLPSAVTVTGAGNALTLTGTQSSAAALNINNTGNGEGLSSTTTGTGSALSTNNSGSGPGATFSSNSGFAVNATTTSGTLFRGIANPSSANTEIVTFRPIRQTSGTATAGMGQIWSADLEDDAGNSITAVQHKTIWASAAAGSTSANYELWSYNTGTLAKRFSIKSTGQAQLPLYGSGTFTGSLASYLVTTSAGDVVEQAASTIPLISTGTAAPATTPGKVGDIYVDTTNKKLYFATGTSSSADWTIAN